MYARVLTIICALQVAGTVAQSRRWFAPELSCWITHQKMAASWQEAQQSCEKNGAVLASPLNTQLFNYMQSLINEQNHSVAYFIGTRAERSHASQEMLYVSVEGRRLDGMSKAVFDAIEQLDLQQGDCLSMDRQGIRSVSCWDHLPYICYSNETTECGTVPDQKPAPVTSTSAPLSLSTIPPGYIYKPATGSFYKFHKCKASWSEANATCASEGAELVVINDAEEADIVARIVRDAIGDNGIWQGLRDNQPGLNDWRTIHGTPLSQVYHEWWENRPYNDAKRPCVAFGTNYKQLLDDPCDYNYYITCEISQ